MFDISPLDKTTAYNLNPQSLAFVGDAVFSLFIRQKIVVSSDLRPTQEHRLTTDFVKAGGQSKIINTIEAILTDEEKHLYKRARNYKTNNVAKNAKVIDYKKATGFEALIGYLYLIGNYARMNELMELGYNAIDQKEQKC